MHRKVGRAKDLSASRYNYKNIQDNMTFYPSEISVYLNRDLFQQHWLSPESWMKANLEMES